jgi:hypothetical protein
MMDCCSAVRGLPAASCTRRLGIGETSEAHSGTLFANRLAWCTSSAS